MEKRVSPQIIRGIQSRTTDDPDMRDFLVDLIYEESQQKGSWHWKKLYEAKVSAAVGKTGGSDAN